MKFKDLFRIFRKNHRTAGERRRLQARQNRKSQQGRAVWRPQLLWWPKFKFLHIDHRPARLNGGVTKRKEEKTWWQRLQFWA